MNSASLGTNDKRKYRGGSGYGSQGGHSASKEGEGVLNFSGTLSNVRVKGAERYSGKKFA